MIQVSGGYTGMGKKKIIKQILAAALTAAILGHLQFGREMDVYNGHSSMSGGFHEERLNIVVNRLIVADKEKCAEEIIKKCRDNSFHSVRFSYDISVPNALFVAVYLSEYQVKSGNPAFTFSYVQPEKPDLAYNIVDNPERFTLILE